MNRNCVRAITVFAVISILLAGWSVPVLAENITIVGEVNDTYQIVGQDGEIYEVADTEVGAELLDTMIGQKVKVNGNLIIDGETKTIEVTGYQLAE